MAQVKIKEKKIISRTRSVLQNISYEIVKRNGEQKKESKEIYTHGDAVTVLLYNREKQNVILTSQFRLATYINHNPSGELLETCAGLLEENENPEDAIIREIKEETGYAVPSVQKVYEAYSSAGCLTELIYFYIAEYRDDQKVSEGGGLKAEGEDVATLEMSFSEALEKLERGDIKDAKTIILLQYAKLKGLF
jgi:GDP-mannose pyrophosphatase NudK